ncbi:DNA gyrase/topoisomerase IV subunit A [Acetobacteroides hydrogenigenes]|uniref:Topoisomerase-4 subunit A n=1 Tax=Acetobacteroides hydrogenigenes TaxID=979970 RepID=A0A4R2EV92_9BACT|nr:DNA gyrase/topoisomerase IV subunit A [Acetobacteroides hydrogenigenes]TCN73249.1 topoisomerase-4 subunit A [Acetobacteroides hydrogenigenes]
MSEELDDRIELEGDTVKASSAEEKAHYQKLMGETKKYRLSGMYKDWFLDYASYVILERAVPHIEDGLKPVQRRIMHAMKKMDDGRYNKVANIIGYTMQYHPHGDASIGDALVQLGQKDLLVDCQGNWGNILTGDSSAAPRYIEARLSKFAGDVVFNPKTTEWMASYDGRNQEPVTLPVKFPLLLAQGVEGIAVGLASKILPHNFIELIDASIAHLRGEDFELYPDFPTAGMVDVLRYNDGLRGGAVKVRAKINKLDKKTLVITEIPFGKTTSSVIESIIKANDKGKIKIKKVDDNTARDVEIVIHLANDVSPDITIDALYAFTDCEVSISPNACVIIDKRPHFIGVKEMLRRSTDRTKELLRMELDIRLRELEEGWHMSSLEKIFIENRIYNSIEECETWEAVIETIDRGLDPFKPMLRREVTTDDIVKLTEIKIKRISKFDTKKADEYIRGLEVEMDEVKNHLAHLIEYTIAYFENIRKKYGKGRERKTEIRSFDVIQATQVVVANEKLYVNRKEGFFGTNLKKEEYVCDCSDIDDVIVFLRDGKYIITKVTDKGFVGKDIIHIAVFKKNDSRTIYNIVYRDGKNGPIYMKRCAITGITRDKEYDMTKGTAGSSILYMSANPNGEAEVLKVYFKPRPRLKKLIVDLDFSELAIKGRSSMGNIFTRYAIHKVVLKEKGVSTLGGQNIWFDDTIRRLNAEGRGTHLGEFLSNDRILVVAKNGTYYTTSYELTNRYEDEILRIEKFDPEKVFSITYYDGEQKFFYVKRCSLEASDRPSELVGEHKASYIVEVNDDDYPQLEVTFGGANASRPAEHIDVDEFIGVKSSKAKGKRVSTYEVGKLEFIEPLDKAPEPEEEELEEGEDGPIDLSVDPEDYSNAKQMDLGL